MIDSEVASGVFGRKLVFVVVRPGGPGITERIVGIGCAARNVE